MIRLKEVNSHKLSNGLRRLSKYNTSLMDHFYGALKYSEWNDEAFLGELCLSESE